MVNSFVFYIYIFISSDFDQKSSANKRVYDMTKDYKKELEMHLDSVIHFRFRLFCLYSCAGILYFAHPFLHHHKKKGSAKLVHANQKQFAIVKQDKPAHLAHRTQNLFHLERPQNQPHNDMTAFFKTRLLRICLNAVNETYFLMISTLFR